MRGELLSAVSESLMLSVEIEPLEQLEDAIVIIISCEGRWILNFRFSIFDWGMEFHKQRFWKKPSILHSLVRHTLPRSNIDFRFGILDGDRVSHIVQYRDKLGLHNL